MIGRLVSILSFLLISLSTYAQIPTAPNVTDDNDKRQGEWVIYYDANWDEIEDTSLAEFYRKLTYENDKPIGLVTDFYLNGLKQWEGELSSDRPNLVNGKVKYYYENGNIMKEGLMKKNNAVGEWGNYTFKGKFSHFSQYKNGEDLNYKLIENKVMRTVKLVEEGEISSAINIIKDLLTLINEFENFNENNYVSEYLAAISKLYSIINQHDDSIKIMEISKEIVEKIYGKYNSDYLYCINNLASEYCVLNNYKNSIKCYSESLKIIERIFGINDSNYVHNLNLLAIQYSKSGQIEMSLKINLECLSIKEKIYGLKHSEYALSLSNIAYDYTALGHFDKAIEIEGQCLKLYQEIYGTQNNLDYATSLNNLAFNYSRIGNFSKSLELNKKALKIKANILGERHPDFCRSLNNLAMDYINLNNSNKSLDLLQKAISNLDTTNFTQYISYNSILRNIAGVYSTLGLYNKALEVNYKCLEFSKSVYGTKHLDYATSLSHLTMINLFLGDYNKSLILNDECLKIKEKILGKTHLDYALTLNTSAEIYSKLNNYLKSISLNLSVLKIYNEFIGNNYIGNSQVLFDLANSYIKISDYKASDSLLIKSFNNKKYYYEKNSLSISEIEKENYIKDLKSDLSNLTSYAVFRNEKNPDLSSKISTFTLNLKGALLNSNNQIKDEVFNSKDTSLINLYENWKLGKLQLGKYYETTLQELEKNGIDLKAEEEHVNALEQELSRKSLSFAESQKRYTWEDVKNKLNPNESYLELIRTNYYDFENDRSTDTVYYAALIIDENTKDYPELVILEKGTQLEKSGFKYYSSFSSGRNKQRLDEYSYQNYWSAIAEKLKGKKRIYVSSDGVYNKINLNVLYNTETGKYLGEEVDIRLVTSGRDLFKTYPETNEELTAVLVGSPKYDLIEEQVKEDDLLVSRDLQQNWIDSLSRGWSISSLPGTAIEVSNISTLMSNNNWEVTTYTEEEAMEGKVKSVSSPTVLHIATHGYFFDDVEKEKDSPTRMMGIDSKKATQNPLLRSGLLFAGAKNTLNGNPPEIGDNGLLTSYEASYMDLRGTELVVLSACNTARGEIKNGEGVYGLQRAIQQAGAENIIMSMWKVDDKVTQEFMTNFYDLWLSGKTKRDAFIQTQMIIKEKYKHPYYWGAFVMIGK